MRHFAVVAVFVVAFMLFASHVHAQNNDTNITLEKTLFKFRWNDRPDADRRGIYGAALVDGEVIMVGGAAGGYNSAKGEGVWSVRLSDGRVSVREISLDGGSQYICPLHHGFVDLMMSSSDKGIVVSVANNGNIDPCGSNFVRGDQGPRGFISYTAPLQKNGLIFTAEMPLAAEIDHGSEFAVVGNHVLIHGIGNNAAKSKIYTFPSLTFVADTAGVVPIGGVGDYIIGYDYSDLVAFSTDTNGILQYNAYKIDGGTLQKVGQISGMKWVKGGGEPIRPRGLVRDPLDPSRAVFEALGTPGKERLFSLKATAGGVQMTEIIGSTPPARTVMTPYGPTSPIGSNLIGVSGEYLVFADWPPSSEATMFRIWKGASEIAAGQLPKERPIWQTTTPAYPNHPSTAFFYNDKLIVVGGHGVYQYQIQNYENGTGNNTGNDTTPPPANATTQTLSLKPGWNLISSSLIGNALFASHQTTCTYTSPLWAFNAGTQQYEQTTQLTGTKKGMWIRVANDCAVTLTGSSQYAIGSFFPLALGAGWNFIAGPPAAVQVSELTGCTITRGPFWYNPSTGWEQSTALEPGKGYALRAASSCSMSYGSMPPLP